MSSAALPAPANTTLTARSYDDQYYREHADAGLDYLKYDHWQKSYAAMVTEATLQSTYRTRSSSTPAALAGRS